MNIAFDASDLCTGRADGTTRYTAELAKRLPELAIDVLWDFYGPCACPSTLPDGGLRANAKNSRWQASKFFGVWTQTRFSYELLRNKPDVLFMPIQQLPIFRSRRMKTVAVIHDLAFHEFPEQFRYKDWLLLHIFSAQVAREADAIIAVSHATKDDIAKYYGRTKNVHVVHHGVDHEKFRVLSDAEKQEGLKKLQQKYPSIQNSYLLFVGQIQPRKNIERLVEAFEKMGEKLQLVIAGGYGWNNEEIYKRIEESSQRDCIIVTGPVSDDLLPALYANAQAFVMPSLQEGFGIPLVEAAACGVPVVTSNHSSMKEIMGDAGVFVDPNDTVSITSGIQKALHHHDELSRKSVVRAQRFSWDKAAQETLRILKEVIILSERR